MSMTPHTTGPTTGNRPRREAVTFPAQRIREYRMQRKMSQAALARSSGMTPGYISKLESGDRELTPDTLEAITAALDLSDKQAFRLFVHAFVPRRLHAGWED